MKTLLIGGDITPAAELLREGGLVAVPTETVYGLAGNGLDASVMPSRTSVRRCRRRRGTWPNDSGRVR